MEEESEFMFDEASSSDESSQNHSKLLSDVSQLYNKQRISKPSRNEPSVEVSEYNLYSAGDSGSQKLRVEDLTGVLSTRATHREITRKVKKINKQSRTLPKPLEKIQEDKIVREVAYKNLKTDLTKWDGVVERNRGSDQLKFPLAKGEDLVVQAPEDSVSSFSKPTELELRVAQVLSSSAINKEEKELEDALYPLSLEEMIEHRKTMARIRARESYKMAKAARQNKIKSKRYHRLLKQERMKKELKDFELLQKTDPEAALEKLKLIEKARAEERATLRHKSTGKWAKSKAIRAKYDQEARAELAEQLTKSRELTKKLQTGSDSEEEELEEGESDEGAEPSNKEGDNPWLNKLDAQVEEFISGYKKFWEEKNKNENSKDENLLPPSPSGKESKASDAQENGEVSKGVSTRKETKASYMQENGEVPKEDSAIDSDYLEGDNSNLPRRLGEDEKVPDSNSQDDSDTAENWDENVGSNEVPENEEVEVVVSGPDELEEAEMTSEEESDEAPSEREQERKISFKGNTFQVSNSAYSPRKEENEENIVNLSGSWAVTPVNSSSTKRKVDDLTLDELFEMAEDAAEGAAEEGLKKFRASVAALSKPGPKKTNKRESNKQIKQIDPKIRTTVLEEAMQELAEQGIHTKSIPDVKELIEITKKGERELPTAAEINPNEFLELKSKKLSSEAPDLVLEEENDSSEDEETKTRQMNLMEAFADDEVVEQFRKEKEKEVKSSQPSDVDLFLPGWGTWAGATISENKWRRKKRRLTFKAPQVKRKDDKKENVIINEDITDQLRQHMVSNVPFPFTSVKDYEASIRAPIGNTWVPQSAHKKLTTPPVITRMGKIIEPMSGDELEKKKKEKIKWNASSGVGAANKKRNK